MSAWNASAHVSNGKLSMTRVIRRPNPHCSEPGHRAPVAINASRAGSLSLGRSGDMDRMRPLVIIVVLFTLCGCQTRVKTQASSLNPTDALAVERVFAGYARHFPEARRVSPPANALKYFAGVYSDNGPSGLGFRGRNLYLFPDGKFILTEWADIMPETSLMNGGWSFEAECVQFTGAAPRDVPVDLTYVPLTFSDSERNLHVLMGTPHGLRTWNSWVARWEPDLRKARESYDRDVRVRKDFRFTTQAEEMLYVTFFHGTYAQVHAFADDWEGLRRNLLVRLQQSKQ
jgi:hypothetical protein